MSNPKPTITIPVNLTNPGQFFACCGLLELADRLWPGAEGWFVPVGANAIFCIWTPEAKATREALLKNAASIRFEGDDNAKADKEDEDDSEDDEKKSAPVDPIVITSPVRIVLDWWSDKSIKPWAGSMKERLIFRAMLRAIDSSHADPFSDERAVFDPQALADGKKKSAAKKREPFYFDYRRGAKAHPLDSGFSPDTHHMESRCFPAVEALCFIGLQRARPAPTDEANRSRYAVWMIHLPANVIAPVVSGIVSFPGSVIGTFDNFFRTDQRKHKSFSQATLERSTHV